ncbi:MAG: MlaD family protein [Gemmatimonadales bacterium]
MHRPIYWSALIPGLVVSGVIAAGASLVLIFGQVGVMHGPTERIYLATDHTRSVTSGTDVWLDGKPVGKVEWIQFQRPTTDTAYRILIAIDVPRSIRWRLRRDTRARISGGTSFIGAPVIALTSGSASARQLADGDTLLTIPRGELDGARASLAIAAQNLPQIVGNVQDVKTAVFSPSGTIGAMGHGDAITRPLVSIADNLDKLSGRLDHRRAAMRDAGASSLSARARRVIAAADSVRRSAAAQAASTSRSHNDSAMVRTIRDARAQIDSVQHSSLRPPRTRPVRAPPSRACNTGCRTSTRSSPPS